MTFGIPYFPTEAMRAVSEADERIVESGIDETSLPEATECSPTELESEVEVAGCISDVPQDISPHTGYQPVSD